MTRSRSRRGRRWGVLLAVVLLLAVLAVAAELVTRGLVQNAVADYVETEFGGQAETTLGSSPVLPQLLTGGLSSVRVDAEGLSYGPLTGARARADLQDAQWDGSDISASRSRMEIDVPAEGLEDAIAEAIADALPFDLVDVTVVPRPEDGQLELRAGPEGTVTLLVTPGVEGDDVNVTVDDVRIADGRVPGLDGALEDLTTYRIADLSDLPLDLSPADVAVTDDGVFLVLVSR